MWFYIENTKSKQMVWEGISEWLTVLSNKHIFVLWMESNSLGL